MARKHENFNYNYGWKTAPEQWSFYYNGKYIPLEHETRNRLACMCLSGKVKEAEDELKRLLYQKVKEIHVQRFPFNDFLYQNFEEENI